MLELLEGESISDEWELVDKREFDDNNTSIEDWAKQHITPKKDTKLGGFIKSNPSQASYLDKDIYKVRSCSTGNKNTGL